MRIIESRVQAIGGLLQSDNPTELRVTVFDSGNVHLSIAASNCEFRVAMKASEFVECADAMARAAQIVLTSSEVAA